MKPTRVLLVPHTHWDREWYLPFEQFLARLVEMMDGLIELMDREPRFRHFHLDGQAAMIDDYLEVRPEREGDLRRLAREGRISVGPWYTQMDEFLVSGESLIRNLEWGLARANELDAGLPPVGYLPDQFGHVGQMPQILRNAGIDRAVVWRGVPAAIDTSAFWWEAPDQSKVLAEYLTFSYALGAGLGTAETAEDLSLRLGQAVDALRPISARDGLLVPVGHDHFAPRAKLAELLEEVNGADGVEAVIGSIGEYLAAPVRDDLPIWRGELRSSARAHLLPGVYSTRVHQKQTRARVEALVERYAEPLAALVPGVHWPEDELREAWRLLLWNGAHDSVCGCSVDEVARAVDRRHERAGIIASAVSGFALAALGARVRGKGTIRFNPSPFERDGVPGLGWQVERGVWREQGIVPPLPTAEERVEVSIEGDDIVMDGLRLRLLDEPDIGDLYSFCPAEGETPVLPTEVTVGEEGIQAAFPGVTIRLRAFRREGEPFVRLEGVVANQRPDHRLRLHVELPEPPTGSLAGAPFELVERPIRGEGGTEVASPTWPARGVVMAADTAVLARSVFDYEVLPDPPGLAVTLLRCVGTISRPHIATRPWSAGPDIPTPHAQMIGDTALALAVFPGASRDRILEAWERFALPLLVAPALGGGDLPQRGSLLDVEGAELSSIRRVNGELEVRIWNPSLEPREARVGDRRVRLGPARIETVRFP